MAQGQPWTNSYGYLDRLRTLGHSEVSHTHGPCARECTMHR